MFFIAIEAGVFDHTIVNDTVDTAYERFKAVTEVSLICTFVSFTICWNYYFL